MATGHLFGINDGKAHDAGLRPEIRARFRIVSIVKPDVEQIFRIKCFEHNFRNPTVLGDKISLLYETMRLYL